MNLRTIASARPGRPFRGLPGAHRAPLAGRRPALYLAVAASGALMVNALTAGEPAAQAQSGSTSIAAQLDVTAAETDLTQSDAVHPLEQLAASRGERAADRTAAVQAQAAADAAAQAAAAEAARVAAEQAAAAVAAQAQAEAAKAHPGQGTSAAAAPSGSYQDYALSKIGASEFGCLENLWGKESGWNPKAQNRSSTAFGIPQFLDSTWAGTGIGKTSDGYRQIDAGLVYIDSRYGSPCGAWSHSKSTGWY